MASIRLAALGALAGAALLGAFVLLDRERPPAAEAGPAPEPKAASRGGVSPRATDSPRDLRERQAQRDGDPGGPPPADAPAEPTPTEPAPAEVAPAPEAPRDDPNAGEPPPAAPPLPASPTREAAMTAAKAAAEGEVAKLRAQMRRECGDAIAAAGVGDRVTLGFSLGFDAEGKVIASAVQQGRDTYVAGLERCLGPFAHGIEVPAPGEPVSVEVELELP